MTNLLKSVEVRAFRGINNLKLGNLGKVNIITGENNSGKTSFLESLMLLAEPSTLYNIIRVARLREVGKLLMPMSRSRLVNYQLFEYLFNRKDEKLLLDINGIYNNAAIQLKIEGNIQKELVNEYMINDYYNNAPYSKSQLKNILTLDEEIETFVGTHIYSRADSQTPGRFQSEEKELYFNKYTIDNFLRNSRRSERIAKYNYISSIDHIIKDSINLIIKDPTFKEEVIDILRIFDEEIEDLVIIENENRYIHCIKSLHNGLMPISMYGDGIKKIITLAAGLASSKNGILLIDEIETSVHKKAMPRVFHWLIESCNKEGIQLFMTTHSLEVVDEILISNSSALKEDLIRVITMKKNNGQTFARVLSGRDAVKLREDFDMELRQ